MITGDNLDFRGEYRPSFSLKIPRAHAERSRKGRKGIGSPRYLAFHFTGPHDSLHGLPHFGPLPSLHAHLTNHRSLSMQAQRIGLGSVFLRTRRSEKARKVGTWIWKEEPVARGPEPATRLSLRVGNCSCGRRHSWLASTPSTGSRLRLPLPRGQASRRQLDKEVPALKSLHCYGWKFYGECYNIKL